ncbi:MAG: hypothetical protein AAB499_00725 [Patescibacteria group bacterium]
MAEVSSNPELVESAADYGRRCEKVGLERRTAPDLQHAMNHPSFKGEHHALLGRLAREYRNSLPLLERPPQFSLRLDIFPSKKKMIAITEAEGHEVSNDAKSVANHKDFHLYTRTEIFDFIPGTVEEVTGEDSVKTPELYAAQARLGLIVAPHPSAFAIRNEYTDQPMDEWRSVLSEPLPDSDGYLSVLYVARDSRGSYVRRHSVRPDRVWFGGSRLWVCRKRLLAV